MVTWPLFAGIGATPPPKRALMQIADARIESCNPPGMRSDGSVLPDLAETVVLHRLGLVRTDEVPDLAARWLVADLVDTESVRMLAGHSPNYPWMLEKLLADSVAEVGEADPESDLGLFIGLDDEWNGGWGRLEPDLKAEAKNELGHFLHGTGAS